MGTLDSTDFLQVISIVVAFAVGFLPSIKPVNGFNKYSVILVMLFIAAVFTAIATTVVKSNSDKENYNNLLSAMDSTLKKANQSIQGLENIQSQTKILQDNSIALADTLQNELNLQKKLNQSAKIILRELDSQKTKTNAYNDLKLGQSFAELITIHYMLYDVLEKSPYKTEWLDSIGFTANETFSYYSDSLDFMFNKFQIQLKKDHRTLLPDVYTFKDIMLKTIYVHDSVQEEIMAFVFTDKERTSSAIKEFIDKTMSILLNQLSNPILNNNKRLYDEWVKYFVSLLADKSGYNVSKYKISEEDILETLVQHYTFVRQLLRLYE